MQEIISAQEGNPDVESEGLVLGSQTFDIVSERDGKVEAIHDNVQKGEKLFSFYASSENKLQMAKELAEEKSAYTVV